jgi:hypothetical protein
MNSNAQRPAETGPNWPLFPLTPAKVALCCRAQTEDTPRP